MGQKGSSWKKDKIPKSPNEVCSKLNSSSSSYYSNYPELRSEAQTESQCLTISYKKKIPQWLRFFHSKCENLAPSQLSWAQSGKILQEMETMRNFREEYDKLFQRKLKQTKCIASNRQSMIQKDPESNLENVLSDLNETAQAPSTIQGLSAAVSKNSDENQQQGSKVSQKTSQLQQSQAQQQSQGQPNPQPGQNTSFPSYMVDNQFQGLRAGNITMLRLQDPESLKKNLQIYFECTALISQHLEDNNFTLSQIRKLFVSCFYNRYSVAIKNFKKINKEIIRKQASLQDKQEPSLPHQGIFQNSLDGKSVDESQDQGVGINGSDCKLGIHIGSLQFASEEKFKPPSEAKKIFKDALSEFEYFVKIFMETIKQYYDIHYLKDPQVNAALKELFSYRNFQNFIVSKLFENEKIPKMLIEVLKIVTPDDTSLIASIQMSNISPYLFGVPPAFSLDADTQRSLGIFYSTVQEEPECAQDSQKLSRNYQQDKQEQKEENDGDGQKDLDSEDEDQDMVFDLKITSKKDNKLEAEYLQNDVQIINSNASSLSQENLFCDNKQPTTQSVNPYQRCIDCIAKIVKSTTPTGKFKQIILACEGIEKCISEYYQKHGKTLKYTLDEDNIISILTYIIAQAQVPNLEAHCKFVNAFYKSPTKKLKLRYYLLAFEVSIRNVHELFSQGEGYEKAASIQQSDCNEDQPADVSMNTSARCLFQKNTSRKLEETFGNSQNPKYIASITGKNSFLKQTLQEIKL